MSAGPLSVLFGTFRGCAIRKARKAGRCQYWRGRDGQCPLMIEQRDFYVEGDVDTFAKSPWARERWCLVCVGAEARASILVHDAQVFVSKALWMSGNGNTIAARNAARDAAHFGNQALALLESA